MNHMTARLFMGGLLAAIACWSLPNFFTGVFNPLYLFIACLVFAAITGIGAGTILSKQVAEGNLTGGATLAIAQLAVVVAQFLIAWYGMQLFLSLV